MNKISKDAKSAVGEKDLFHLLLELAHRFRAEERKKKWREVPQKNARSRIVLDG